MENPYSAPTQAAAPPTLRPFRWIRILAWVALIYVAGGAVGILSGLSMLHWEIYGDTIEVAVKNARLVRRIAYGLICAFLYWRLAAGVERRLLHVVVTFAVLHAIDLVSSFFVFQVPADELIDVWSIGRSALAAAAALGAASLSANRSSKPTALRGKA